jgi:hypothetical protein
MNNQERRTPMWRLALCIVVTASMAGVAVGCGNDDAKIERAKQQVRKEALSEAKAKATASEVAKLRRQVNKLRRQGPQKRTQSSGGGSGNTSSSGAYGSTSCGEGLSVNSVTSCSFARNVRDQYRYSGGASVIDVYSPVTKITYTMYCSDGVPTICTGGNNAAVYIR